MPASNPGATDSNFERTFSDLAYARLRDKAPTLLDYLIGFQLLDKNEEGTHAVGVFGFKIGKEWVYCPVFFINGELKGHELMYIKSQDAFVPMMEQWVNYILNRRPHVLGELDPTPQNRLGLRQPDFDLFARSPYIGSKYASASTSRSFNDICAMLEKNNPDFLPAMDMFTAGPKHEKFASLNERFTLTGAIEALGKQAAVTLIATMRNDPKFAESVLSFYDIQDLIKSAEKGAIEDENRRAKKARARELRDKAPSIGLKSAAELDEVFNRRRRGPFTFPKAVVVTRGDDGSNVEQDLSDGDKAKLMREQYVVKDPRTADQKTRLYKSQVAATLNSPFQTGFYEVLTPTGETRRALIVQQPRKLGWAHNYQDVSTLLIDPESKRFGNFRNSDILTSKWLGQPEYDKFVEGLSSPKSLGIDDYAVLLAPNGAGTNVFRVNSVTTLPDGRTQFNVHGYNQPAASANLSGQYRSSLSPVSDHDADMMDTILLTGKDGKDPQQVGRTFFVPNSFKAFVLKSSGRKPSEASKRYYEPGDAEFGLGNWNELLTDMKKSGSAGLVTLQVFTDGIRFVPVVNEKRAAAMTKVAAVKFLIEKQGLDQGDAELVLKEAEPRKKTTYWMKYAYGEPPRSAVFEEPRFGDEYGIRAPIQYPQTTLENLSQNDNLGSRELYRSDRWVDDDSKRYAQAATNQGQKEVMDTSVISGLVKTMDTDSAVDGYISDLLLGLDRVGRILFMFYWKNMQFKERYGQQDMVELEDNLRNVFKNLGELTLFLKQKTVEPEQSEGSEPKLDEVVGAGM